MKIKTPTLNWRLDVSAKNKETVVEERFNGSVPSYLWYELPEELAIEDAMIRTAVALLFGNKNPSHGDIEIHRSKTASVTHCLRVRDATCWQPKLNIGGRNCFLYMIGHGQDNRHFNFQNQWDRASFRPGTHVAVPESIFRNFSIGVDGTGLYDILPQPKETFIVVETRFDSAARQTFILSELAGINPILASVIMNSLVDKGGTWSIPETDVEIVQVTDANGNQREFCASMLKEITK